MALAALGMIYGFFFIIVFPFDAWAASQDPGYIGFFVSGSRETRRQQARREEEE